MLLSNLLSSLQINIIPLLLSVIGFGFLIIIHELGHFLFCKLFGVHTPTFSIGFGPRIIEKKIGETNFRLSAIPFGGYVEMAGNAEIGQGDQAFAQATGDNSFASKAYWQKFFIMCGGIIFNFISAYIIFCALFMIGDSSKITVVKIMQGSAAEKAGLLAGDELLSFNNISLVPEEGKALKEKYTQFFDEIAEHPNKEVSIKIQRKDTTLLLQTILGTKERDGHIIGSLGASFTPCPIQKLPFLQAIKEGVSYTNSLVCTIAYGLKHMFAQKNLDGAGGPLAIISMGFQTAQHGLIDLFIFLAMMSINLALFNLLPLGIVDGGQLLFVTIEAIIRRPTPDWLKMGINLLSLGLFVLLFVYLTYKDIVTLFGKPLTALYQKATYLFGF